MTINTNTKKNTLRWNRIYWLWVFLCVAGIYATVPVARGIQLFVYETAGKDFFTYIVLFVVCSLLAALLYFFIFRLKVRNASQYIWLLLCSGLYIYLTIQLREHPEEAVHLLQYGLLSYFVFNALSYKIRDWTVYPTTVLFVLFFGITDEFIQWMMPKRFWGLGDVWINVVASMIFVLAVWKGIVPQSITGRVRKASIKMLTGVMIINLAFIGVCLSNTPDAVLLYTAAFNKLSWLQGEEPMTEFGYKHEDPEIGIFYSKLTLEEIRWIDRTEGSSYGKRLPEDISSKSVMKELFNTYSLNTNAFLHEFLIHVSRRNSKFDDFMETNNSESRLAAFKENQIIEKYYASTLNNSHYIWPDEKRESLGNTDSLKNEDYASTTGRMITLFSLKEVWILLIIMLACVSISSHVWRKKLSAD